MPRSTNSSAFATSIAATGSKAAPPSPNVMTAGSRFCAGSASRRARRRRRSRARRGRPDARSRGDRRLASAGQWRGAHLDVARRRAPRKLGVEVVFLTPEGFASVPVPTYPGLRCALPSPREIARRIEAGAAGRDPYRDRGHDRPPGAALLPASAACPSPRATPRGFPNISRRALPIPEAWSYAVLRRFHAAATVTMVSTPSLIAELTERGFKQPRHVDARRRHRAVQAPSAPSISICRGRSSCASAASRSRRTSRRSSRSICPGSKVVIGQGPQEAELRRRFPDAKFMGLLGREDLARLSRGVRRVRVPEPHRHVRRRAARSARLRRAGRGLSGDRAEGRDRRRSGRRAARGSARRLHGGAARVAASPAATFALARSWETSARSSSATSTGS